MTLKIVFLPFTNNFGTLVISNNGLLVASIVNLFGGSIEGFGFINSSIFNNGGWNFDEISYVTGVVRPGGQGSIGNLTFTNYNQTSNGKIDINIGLGTFITCFYVIFQSLPLGRVINSLWFKMRIYLEWSLLISYPHQLEVFLPTHYIWFMNSRNFIIRSYFIQYTCQSIFNHICWLGIYSSHLSIKQCLNQVFYSFIYLLTPVSLVLHHLTTAPIVLMEIVMEMDNAGADLDTQVQIVISSLVLIQVIPFLMC